MRRQFYVSERMNKKQGKDGKEMRKWCVVFTAVAVAFLMCGCGKPTFEKIKETVIEAMTEVQTEASTEAVIETETEKEVPTEAVIETEAETETVFALPAETEAEELQISLNISTISFTKLNETFRLIATVTPSDTTDGLTWSSSNESVATVSSDGVVTSKGVGTTTITVQCGSYSASCSVISVVIFSESDLLRADNYGVIAYSYSEGNDAAQFAGNPTYPMVCYGLETGVLSDYEVAVNSSETVGSQVYGIPIPSNATTLHITLPDTTGTKIRLCNISYHDSESLQTSVAGVTACKYVGFETYDNTSFGDSGTTLTIDLTSSKPSEADSICLYVQADSGTAQDISDPITIEFS